MASNRQRNGVSRRNALLHFLLGLGLLAAATSLVAELPAQEESEAPRHAEATLPATEPIVIEYRADPGCPSTGEFHRLVFERTTSARLAKDSEPARVFVAELRRTAGRFTGSLVIRERNGTSVARRVSGRQCTEVATVLALASALAIDPNAKLAPNQILEDGEAPAAHSSPDGSPSARTTAEPEDALVTAPSERAEGLDTDWLLSAALGPRLVLGVGPRPSVGGGLLLGATSGAHRQRVFWGLELGALQSFPTKVRDARADFQFFTARPQLCPIALRSENLGALAPCVSIELGILRGRGSSIPFSETSLLFWAAPELALRWEMPIGEHWFVQADLAAEMPLTRYRFVFENPETSIHRVPVVTAATALRAGIRY